jgi:hypothetical protein
MTHFNWSPKIGDPTIGGWLTVVLYILAAGSCWISARELVLEDIGSNERRAWLAISALFLALGINKQLDLQSALTEAGRVLAHYQGWFEQRQLVQLAHQYQDGKDAWARYSAATTRPRRRGDRMKRREFITLRPLASPNRPRLRD